MQLELSQIYKNRFSDLEKRNRVWSILVADFFQKFVKEGDVVLDMPCGYGQFINHVRCGRKIGLDLNPDAAKHLNPGVEFLARPSTDTGLDPQSVDFVFISNFFEHLPRADIVATISELRRILRPGGRVVVLQPDIRYCPDYWMFFDHITPIDGRALIEAFETTGFTTDRYIDRFLPFTMQGSKPTASVLIRLYVRMPWMWRFFGAQGLLAFSRSE